LEIKVLTIRLGYQNQSVKALWEDIRCFFWYPYKKGKLSACTKFRNSDF